MKSLKLISLISFRRRMFLLSWMSENVQQIEQPETQPLQTKNRAQRLSLRVTDKKRSLKQHRRPHAASVASSR